MVLKELDYKCNLCKVQISPHATSCDWLQPNTKLVKKNSQHRWRGKRPQWPPPIKLFLFWWIALIYWPLTCRLLKTLGVEIILLHISWQKPKNNVSTVRIVSNYFHVALMCASVHYQSASKPFLGSIGGGSILWCSLFTALNDCMSEATGNYSRDSFSPIFRSATLTGLNLRASD